MQLDNDPTAEKAGLPEYNLECRYGMFAAPD
jgi:hypothetical protein